MHTKNVIEKIENKQIDDEVYQSIKHYVEINPFLSRRLAQIFVLKYDELVHDITTFVIEYIGTYKKEKASLSTHIYDAVKNFICNLYKKYYNTTIRIPLNKIKRFSEIVSVDGKDDERLMNFTRYASLLEHYAGYDSFDQDSVLDYRMKVQKLHDKLTKTQWDIFRYTMAGFKIWKIMQVMHISHGTYLECFENIRTHVKKIFEISDIDSSVSVNKLYSDLTELQRKILDLKAKQVKVWKILKTLHISHYTYKKNLKCIEHITKDICDVKRMPKVVKEDILNENDNISYLHLPVNVLKDKLDSEHFLEV